MNIMLKLVVAVMSVRSLRDIQGGYRDIKEADRIIRDVYEEDEEVPLMETVYMAYQFYYQIISIT